MWYPRRAEKKPPQYKYDFKGLLESLLPPLLLPAFHALAIAYACQPCSTNDDCQNMMFLVHMIPEI